MLRIGQSLQKANNEFEGEGAVHSEIAIEFSLIRKEGEI